MSEQTADAKARGSIFNLKVRPRLILGFSAVCLVLVVVVGVTIWRVGQITENVERIDESFLERVIVEWESEWGIEFDPDEEVA